MSLIQANVWARKKARNYETSLQFQFSTTVRAEPTWKSQFPLTRRAGPNAKISLRALRATSPKFWPKRLGPRAYYEPSLGSFQLYYVT